MATLRMKDMYVTMRTEFYLDMLPSHVFISLVNIQICFTLNIALVLVVTSIEMYLRMNK
jgi:hypothetical protein